MSNEKKIEWVFEHVYDRRTARHRMDGVTMVLHCHHYTTLTCQLADDAEIVDGKQLLRRAAELSFHDVLTRQYGAHGVTRIADRVALAEEYWKLCGMGILTFEYTGAVAATARMDHSHVDEGWIKKWGTRDRPVNFIGQGYIAAALSAINDRPIGFYTVMETQSIVAGAPCSRFQVTAA